MTADRAHRLNLAGAILSIVSVLAAIIWVFPIYWGIISSITP
mgnify:CR=1 FL=1